jgi:hypothetical protein
MKYIATVNVFPEWYFSGGRKQAADDPAAECTLGKCNGYFYIKKKGACVYSTDSFYNASKSFLELCNTDLKDEHVKAKTLNSFTEFNEFMRNPPF